MAFAMRLLESKDAVCWRWYAGGKGSSLHSRERDVLLEVGSAVLESVAAPFLLAS
jgi:hypothetical protein